MNPKLIAIIQQAVWRLPNWCVSTLAVIFGAMVALNIVTFEALTVFFQQPVKEWVAELWNLLIGSLIAGGGIAFDPRSEKAPMLLTDKVTE